MPKTEQATAIAIANSNGFYSNFCFLVGERVKDGLNFYGLLGGN